jgi:flagellar hook-basal body complex protein FliE
MKINEFAPDTEIFKKIGSKDNKEDTSEKASTSFGDLLKKKLDSVNDDQIKAEDTTQKFIQGDETDIHKVMLDTEEAKMSLELAVQIRNKFVEAYQELSRTQL